MGKILFYSFDLEQEGYLDELISCTGHEAQLCFGLQNMEKLAQSQDYKLLVVYWPSGLKAEQIFSPTIKKMAQWLPVLGLARDVEGELYKRAAESRRIRLWDLNIPEVMTVEFIKKYLQHGELEQQKFPRYSTNEVANVEKYGEGSIGIGNLKNLSYGGAYLEWDIGDVSFVTGDLLRLTVELESGRVYKVSGEVVWTKVQSDEGKDVGGMGVNFIKSSDLHDKMVERF